MESLREIWGFHISPIQYIPVVHRYCSYFSTLDSALAVVPDQLFFSIARSSALLTHLQ